MPLLKFKIERENLVLESLRLGKNYFVISDVVITVLVFKVFRLFSTFFITANKADCNI